MHLFLLLLLFFEHYRLQRCFWPLLWLIQLAILLLKRTANHRPGGLMVDMGVDIMAVGAAMVIGEENEVLMQNP